MRLVAGDAVWIAEAADRGGLIEESDERPAPELDDARRRYYRLTRSGRRVLDAECDRLQELVRAFSELKADHMVTE